MIYEPWLYDQTANTQAEHLLHQLRGHDEPHLWVHLVDAKEAGGQAEGWDHAPSILK